MTRSALNSSDCGYRDAERTGHRQVDEQLKLDRLLDWQVSSPDAL